MMNRSIILALACVLVAGCATDADNKGAATATPKGPVYLDTAYADFRADMQKCTKKTGYDPDKTEGLGPYQLGRNELAWRRCAYNSVQTHIVPETRYPELYLALVAQDKELTRLLRQRKVTRETREKRIAAMIKRIEQAELGEVARERPGIANDERARRAAELRRSTALIVNNTMMGPLTSIPGPR